MPGPEQGRGRVHASEGPVQPLPLLQPRLWEPPGLAGGREQRVGNVLWPGRDAPPPWRCVRHSSLPAHGNPSTIPNPRLLPAGHTPAPRLCSPQAHTTRELWDTTLSSSRRQFQRSQFRPGAPTHVPECIGRVPAEPREGAGGRCAPGSAAPARPCPQPTRRPLPLSKMAAARASGARCPNQRWRRAASPAAAPARLQDGAWSRDGGCGPRPGGSVRDRAGNGGGSGAGAAGADVPQGRGHGWHHGARQRQHRGGHRRFAGRGCRGPGKLAAPAQDAAQEGERGRETGKAAGRGTGELGPLLSTLPQPLRSLSRVQNRGKNSGLEPLAPAPRAL